MAWLPIFLMCGLQLVAGSSGNRFGKVVEAVPPSGLTGWDVPYPYSGQTVTGAKIMMNASTVREWNGKDQNNIQVDIIGQGPVTWSLSRFNEGDLSPRLAPRRPYAQPNLCSAYGVDGFSSSDPRNFALQAWSPAPQSGILLAAVAQNGQQWNDGQPRFYGTVAAVTQSSGYGYSMLSGQFETGKDAFDLTVGKVGAGDEANIDVAIAYFPYQQGWRGGYLQAPGEDQKALWLGELAHGLALPEDAGKIVEWSDKGAFLKLPGVNAERDGMLFTISTDPGRDNNDVNLMSVTPTHKGWQVQAREDKESAEDKLAAKSEWMFAFVYIPYSAPRLVGGRVCGKRGHVVRRPAMQWENVEVKRLQEGQYRIVIGEHGKTDRDGILLLQVAGESKTAKGHAPHAVLSYNYGADGALVVEARKLAGSGGTGEEYPLTDTGFYFVWVDFLEPLAPSPVGDTRRRHRTSAPIGYLFGVITTLVLVGLGALAFRQVAARPRRFSFIPFMDFAAAEESLSAELLNQQKGAGDFYVAPQE